MKQLVLMRHAKTNQAHPGQLDIERTLTERGEKDALEMGKRIHHQQFHPHLILTSHSKRTTETANIVARKLAYPIDLILLEPLIYMAHTDDLLYLIRNLDNRLNQVLMIGHNPTFASLVGTLTPSIIERLPTAGVALISFETSTWQQISNHLGKLEWFDYPKNNA